MCQEWKIVVSDQASSSDDDICCELFKTIL